jgi:hypothetical protein
MEQNGYAEVGGVELINFSPLTAGHSLKVSPGTKALTGAGQNQYPQVAILGGRAKRLARFAEHAVGHPIETVRTVHYKAPDGARLFVQDRLEAIAAHNFSPW